MRVFVKMFSTPNLRKHTMREDLRRFLLLFPDCGANIHTGQSRIIIPTTDTMIVYMIDNESERLRQYHPIEVFVEEPISREAEDWIRATVR